MSCSTITVSVGRARLQVRLHARVETHVARACISHICVLCDVLVFARRLECLSRLSLARFGFRDPRGKYNCWRGIKIHTVLSMTAELIQKKEGLREA